MPHTDSINPVKKIVTTQEGKHTKTSEKQMLATDSQIELYSISL